MKRNDILNSIARRILALTLIFSCNHAWGNVIELHPTHQSRWGGTWGDGDIINLTDDVTMDESTNVKYNYYRISTDQTNPTVILDLQGHTFTCNGGGYSTVTGTYKYVFFHVNVGTLRIRDTVGGGKIVLGTTAKRCFEVAAGAKLVIENNVTISGFNSERGGCAYVSGTVDFNEGTIDNCYGIYRSSVASGETLARRASHCDGGAFYIANGGSVNINGGTISNCHSRDITTGFFVWDTYSYTEGGAVYIDSGGTLNMSSGTITGCWAGRGGAVYVYNAAKFNMSGGTITNCKTPLTSVHTDLVKTPELNGFRDFGGGAVMVRPGGTFTMSNGTIKNCHSDVATWGAGIYNAGTVLMEGGTISGCMPEGWSDITITSNFPNNNYGGGVYQSGAGEFTMKGGTITGCASGSGGGLLQFGGVNGNPVFNLDGGTITGNFAVGKDGLANGGGAYIEASTFNFKSGKITKNKAGRYGGGINLNDGASLNLSGSCEISENEASHGGGISQEAGDCQITLANEGIDISKNKANGGNRADKEGFGGGIFLEFGNMTFTRGTISENQATGGGGGIALRPGMRDNDLNYGNMTVSIGEDALISTNEAQGAINGYGGGIDISIERTYSETGKYKMQVDVNGGTITSNTAAHGGGGISIRPSGSGHYVIYNEINVNVGGSAQILGNKALSSEYGSGGGIGIDVRHKPSSGTCNINVNVTGGTFNQNEAQRSGGAIYCYVERSVTAYKATVNLGNAQGTGSFVATENKAKGLFGGAIGVSNGTFNIYQGNITKNTAQSCGGGIFGNEGTVINILGNVTISQNQALTRLGGGMHVTNGTINITESCKIFANQANEAGGGIGHENGNLKVSGNVEVLNNTAITKGGGAIYVTGGSVDITNGTFSGNVCVNGKGGGLYVHNSDGAIVKDVLFDGGTFSYNEAYYGGGACIDGLFNLKMSANFEYNTAKNGGGICLLNGAHMDFGAGLIRNNKAEKKDDAEVETGWHETYDKLHGVGGGIFMDSNTELIFSDASGLGLYNNSADNAADGIFVNGIGTKITLPDIYTMNLKGYNMPTGKLYWMEDYPRKDPHYNDGTKADGELNLSDVYRYKYALRNRKQTHHLETDKEILLENKYACLALGYDLVYVKLIKKGLEEGANASIKVSYKDGSDNLQHYCDVLMTGVAGGGDVVRYVAVPAGDWRFEETPLSWHYNEKATRQPTFSPAHTNGFISIAQGQNDEITITNVIDNIDIRNAEDVKPNRMTPVITVSE